MFLKRTVEDEDHCCPMASTVSSENVSRVESLTEKDPKPTYTETPDIVKISPGSLTRIVNGCIGVRKRCARWLPLQVSEEQKLAMPATLATLEKLACRHSEYHRNVFRKSYRQSETRLVSPK